MEGTTEISNESEPLLNKDTDEDGVKNPKTKLKEILCEAPYLGLFPNDLLSLFEKHLADGKTQDAYVAIVQYLESVRDLIPRIRDRPATQSEKRKLEKCIYQAHNVQNTLIEQMVGQNLQWVRDQKKNMDLFEWQKMFNEYNRRCRVEVEDVPDPLGEIEERIWRNWDSKSSGPKEDPEPEEEGADPSKLPYFKLQEIFKNSPNPVVVERCHRELKRRKEIADQWHKKKVGSYSQAQARLSRSNSRRFSSVIGGSTRELRPPHTEQASTSVFYDSDPESRGPDMQVHRFFYLPMQRTSDPSRKRFHYSHFFGEQMVRFLEISRSNKVAKLLVQGDAEMPTKTLTELGLPLSREAEIPREKFELVWQRYGGRPWLYNETS